MKKEQLRKWYARVCRSLSDTDRAVLDQSEELCKAIANQDYFLAEQIVLKKFPDSAWTI